MHAPPPSLPLYFSMYVLCIQRANCYSQDATKDNNKSGTDVSEKAQKMLVLY